MAKRITKEELFRQSFECCRHTLSLVDAYFLNFADSAEGTLTTRVFGTDPDHAAENDSEVAQEAFRTTIVWDYLDALYNYAVEGVLPIGEDPEEIQIRGAEALDLVSNDKFGADDPYQLVIAADSRLSLDQGMNTSIERLANLANVDERTVRNAISAGDLTTDGGKPVSIDNQSARSWLRNRRGYKPTKVPSAESASFTDVDSPLEFGAFLKSEYERLYPDTARGTLIPMHSAITSDTIGALEAGVFDLPIDACSVLADFYRIERRVFLVKVMETFYLEELQALTQEEAGKEKGVKR